MRKRILAGEPRIDGRDTALCVLSPVKWICAKAHGSALFTRGETQAIGAVLWALPVMHRLLMHWKVSVAIRLCCTTTSLPTQ